MPSSVAKKIRDLERLINKLNGKIDDGLTKRLAQLKEEKRENEVKMKERTNSVKYHMVKFVERKKIIRKVKSVDSKIKDCNDILQAMRANGVSLGDNDEFKKVQRLVEDYKAKRVNLHNDLAYILYYPKDMKYISLFNEEEDTKSKKLMEIAREKAISSRQHDIDCGNDDKVLHAILVEYQSESGKIKTKRRSKEGGSQAAAAEDTPMKKDKINNRNERSRGSGSNEGGSITSKKSVSSRSDDSESDDSDSDSDDSSSSSSSSSDDSDSDNKSDDNEPKKEINIPSERKERVKSKELTVKSAAVEAADKQIENDAFFLEEKGDDDDEDDSNVQSGSTRRPSSRGRPEKPYISRSKGRPPVPLKDTSGMTKQELRLYQWQMKRKSNNLGRIPDLTTVRKSRDGFVIDGVDKKSKSKSHRDEGSKPHRAHRDETVQGDRSYHRSEAREPSNRSNKREYDSTKAAVDTSKFTNKSAWELGKGISAKSATELVKQKNTGAIKLDQPPQAKKIKFDD